MHISSVIKISFCRISFSGHQNKFCACLDSIYGSRVVLVMCKNCSDIRWHRLNSNQSKTNCPKNLNSDGLIVREMGPWPECIFRSLLQFLVIKYPRGQWVNFILLYSQSNEVEAGCTGCTLAACSLICPLTHPPLEKNGLHFAAFFFQVHFYEWKVLYFDQSPTEVSSLESIWQ